MKTAQIRHLLDLMIICVTSVMRLILLLIEMDVFLLHGTQQSYFLRYTHLTIFQEDKQFIYVQPKNIHFTITLIHQHRMLLQQNSMSLALQEEIEEGLFSLPTIVIYLTDRNFIHAIFQIAKHLMIRDARNVGI